MNREGLPLTQHSALRTQHSLVPFVFFAFFVVPSSLCAADAGAPLADPLQIEGGLVSGQAVEKGDVRVYKGIPFAAPPVGPLRWKAPQPVTSWDTPPAPPLDKGGKGGVRACTEFGNWCPQPKPLMGRDLGPLSEDCLYLNVWTPAKKRDDKLPVMVWIHGGGYTTGSGAQSFYSGESLAREGVVVVTINYRLGPFGFLAHPLLSKESAKAVSGNYGLLDQIAALQWVQKNIAAFGGNPECVTIFGESAGSASVCRLMVCPLAAGLFHRAIAESGGPYGQNRALREQRGRLASGEQMGEEIAKALGCDTAPDVLAALRAKSADEILQASNPAQGLFGKGNKFGPVVDGWVLPDDPGRLWDQGKQAAVPFITGTNADEGTVFLQQVQIKRVAGYRFSARLLYGEDADEVLKLFPAQNDDEVPGALNKLVTVMSFVSPARMLVRAMAQRQAPAYLYHFTRVPATTRARKLGACHAIEIPYVFKTLGKPKGFDAKDEALAQAMCSYWANFAKTGNPNGAGLSPWPAYAADKDEYLELGDEIKAKSALYKDACDLLEKVYRKRSGKAGADNPAP